MELQEQYDRIYSFFKTTTEPFDYLEWDGNLLLVWLDEDIIEIYYLEDLQDFPDLDIHGQVDSDNTE
jgi:hypothetical protein